MKPEHARIMLQVFGIKDAASLHHIQGKTHIVRVGVGDEQLSRLNAAGITRQDLENAASEKDGAVIKVVLDETQYHIALDKLVFEAIQPQVRGRVKVAE